MNGIERLETLGSAALPLLELLATGAFALSGVLEAARKRMDIVGVCVVACLAAFGGGTLRDVLLDHRPFFWVRHQAVLIGVLALAIIAISLLRQRHFELTERAILWPDAVGLGLFCASGVHLASTLGTPPLVAIVMGVVTGIFGGVLRDMVCNEIPATLKDHRPYAVCAVAGGTVYAALSALGSEDWVAISVCALSTFGLRAAAIRLNWSLPAWRPD